MSKEIRESTVENYLVTIVKHNKGEVRKVNWIGRRGAPDRRVMLPWVGAWVELKRPGGKLEPHQYREHRRMRALGETVVVLDSINAINGWLKDTQEDAMLSGWSP